SVGQHGKPVETTARIWPLWQTEAKRFAFGSMPVRQREWLHTDQTSHLDSVQLGKIHHCDAFDHAKPALASHLPEVRQAEISIAIVAPRTWRQDLV
ncbi:MAG TPA: hypothetical protein VGP68_17800, partial [Gemmataceae bacterium]|nr:hypothetical protein [Gemmataceae bacterium]